MHRWTSILKQSGLSLKRGLGQNFLVQESVLERIAAELPLGADVVEIGSGPGNLTAFLAARARHVWAFEIDPEWMKFARERVTAPNVEWRLEDGEGFARRIEGRPHGVSNLPYAHYHRLTLALFEADLARICLTLQEDVVRKFLARPGDDAYGPLAVLAQTHYEVRRIFGVPRTAFFPVPRVDSSFFSLTPTRRMTDVRRRDAALKWIFSQRRKKARAVGLVSDLRVADLEPEALLQCADAQAGRDS